MDSADLTPAQAAAIGAAVTRQLAYLGRLRTRMERMGFPPADPLYLATCAAWRAAHELRVGVHYLTCDRGTVGGLRLARRKGEARRRADRRALPSEQMTGPRRPRPIRFIGSMGAAVHGCFPSRRCYG